MFIMLLNTMIYVIPCQQQAHIGRSTILCTYLGTIVIVENDVDVHDSGYFHGTMRLNYELDEKVPGYSRERVGRADISLVLCAIGLDAGS